MPIYNLISNFFLFFSLQASFAADDLASFCFEPEVSLKSVRHSIDFILLEKDRVSFREEDHCLDVVTTETRKNLLEKFLAKKYTLKREAPPAISECRIELKTITKKKQATQDFKAGEKNNLAVSDSTSKATTTLEMLLGAGLPGTLSLGTQTFQNMGDQTVQIIGAQTLQVECRPSGIDSYELIFYFDDKTRATVSTKVSVKKNEVLNVANVSKVLDEKNKIVGIPQTAIVNTEGIEETNYELKVY